MVSTEHTAMDTVKLYAIATLANGTPHTFERRVPARSCASLAKKMRAAYPTAVIWCRSELRQRRLADELPEKGEYVPDFIDMLGMPPRTGFIR